MQAGMAVPGTLDNWLSTERQLNRKLAWRRSYAEFELPATYSASAASLDWSKGQTNSAFSFAGNKPADAAGKTRIQNIVRDVGNGLWYNRIQNYVKSIPKAASAGKGPFVDIAMIHEADSKFNIGLYTAAEINAAQVEMGRAIKDLRTAGNFQAINQVRFVVNLTAFYWYNTQSGKANDQSKTLQASLLAADVVAADPYGKGVGSPTGLQKDFYDWCDQYNRPGCIWEFSTALSQPGGRPQWIKDFFAYAYNRNAIYILGFNSAQNGSTPIISDAASLKAFQDSMDIYTTTSNPTDPNPPPDPPPIFDGFVGMQGRVLNMNWQ